MSEIDIFNIVLYSLMTWSISQFFLLVPTYQLTYEKSSFFVENSIKSKCCEIRQKFRRTSRPSWSPSAALCFPHNFKRQFPGNRHPPSHPWAPQQWPQMKSTGDCGRPSTDAAAKKTPGCQKRRMRLIGLDGVCRKSSLSPLNNVTVAVM